MRGGIQSSRWYLVRLAATLLSLIIYFALSFGNFVDYLALSARRLSGENYEHFAVRQMWINPIVRIPNEVFGYPGIIVERYTVESLTNERTPGDFSFFLYTIVEILALDFVLGGLLWLGVVELVVDFIRRKRSVASSSILPTHPS